MVARVVIVDDDAWVRRGRAQALAEIGIEVVAAVSPADALADASIWDRADVLVVDAWDPGSGFDRFPGVGVVRAVRSHQRGGSIAVVVVTGHVVNDMLRLRMAEAGADYFYGHEDVSNAERLASAILGAHTGSSTSVSALHPDAALDWIRQHGVQEAFEGETQKTLPFSRRAILHIRREVSARAGIGEQTGPRTWREVVRFVNRARGVELRRPTEPE